MKVEIFKNAHNNEFKFVSSTDLELGLKHISKISFGSFYTEEGNKIETSVRRGGFVGDRVLDSSPSFFKTEIYDKKFKGKSIYLGPLMSHYGHFITESLSRFWMLDYSYFDNIVFSSFIFQNKITEFQKEIFEIFNIENVIVINKPSFFEEVWIPEQLWTINLPPQDGLSRVYFFIREYYKRKRSFSFNKKSIFTSKMNKKYFLSDKNLDGRVKNKKEIEKIFFQKGCEIIYPEEMSFAKQISYYLNAKVLIGFSGTLVHNALFCDSHFTKVIEIGDIRSGNRIIPMQQFVYDISGVEYKYLNYIGDADGNIDLEYIKNINLEQIEGEQ